MEMEFMVYNLVFIMKMTVYTNDSCDPRDAPAPFHFMAGISSRRRESETLGSL